jgi:hypothetical protein
MYLQYCTVQYMHTRTIYNSTKKLLKKENLFNGKFMGLCFMFKFRRFTELYSLHAERGILKVLSGKIWSEWEWYQATLMQI